MNLEELKEKYEELGKAIVALEGNAKTVDGDNEYVMRLKPSEFSGELKILINDFLIGLITYEGKLSMLYTCDMLREHERWLETGMNVSNDALKWRG